jgi:hypothetical protein
LPRMVMYSSQSSSVTSAGLDNRFSFTACRTTCICFISVTCASLKIMVVVVEAFKKINTCITSRKMHYVLRAIIMSLVAFYLSKSRICSPVIAVESPCSSRSKIAQVIRKCQHEVLLQHLVLYIFNVFTGYITVNAAILF